MRHLVRVSLNLTLTLTLILTLALSLALTLTLIDHLMRHRVEMPADLVLPAALDERGTEQREAAAAVGAQPG